MAFLIVERDETMRSGLKELLRLVWPQTAVVAVGTGTEAIQASQSRAFQLVLLADNIRDLSPTDVVQATTSQDLSVIGLTIHSAEYDEQTAEFCSHTQSCLQKPFTIEQLVDQIRRCLSTVALPLLML